MIAACLLNLEFQIGHHGKSLPRFSWTKRVPGTCEKIDFADFAIVSFQWVTL
jgi:hypothetical protein